MAHGYQDMKPEIFKGDDFDPLGSRDVIGHVSIGSADPGTKQEVDQSQVTSNLEKGRLIYLPCGISNCN